MYVSMYVQVPALPKANAPWAVTCLHHHNIIHEKAARVGDPYSSRPPTFFSLPASIRVHSMTLDHRRAWYGFRRGTYSLLGTKPFADSFQGVMHTAVGVVRNKPTVVIIDNVIVIPVQAWLSRSTAHSHQTLEKPLHL
jgi:hypothetical protein